MESRCLVKTPLNLDRLQTYVGGFIRFIDLPTGGVLVVNEAAPAFAPINETATRIACEIIHGHVVVCAPSEIA